MSALVMILRLRAMIWQEGGQEAKEVCKGEGEEPGFSLLDFLV